jgi:1-acyl-sn-glycerol-3-phosphate acyltransferase
MRSALMLTCVVTQLILWDIWHKLLRSISSRLCRAVMNRNLAGMARRLVAIVRTYTGIRFEFDPALQTLPPNPTVVCANHQSVADIAVLLASLPNHTVRFVAKRELARGFPAVSDILRTQGHALIHRKGNPREMATTLKKLAQRIPSGISPAVFPEGTRSRDGHVGEFQYAGVRALLLGRTVPITAVAVDGGYRFVSLEQLSKAGPNDRYRTRMVGVFEHDGTKRGIVAALDAARDAIVEQIEEWRENGASNQGT